MSGERYTLRTSGLFVPANTVLTSAGWATASTSMLAANAATVLHTAVVGTTSSPTTASASYATIAEMTTGTIATGGGDLIAHFSGTFFNSVGANNADIAFSLDGAAEVAVRTVSLGAGSLASVVAITKAFTGVSAGNHTITVRWKTGGGTLTGLSTQRDLTVWERKR